MDWRIRPSPRLSAGLQERIGNHRAVPERQLENFICPETDGHDVLAHASEIRYDDRHLCPPAAALPFKAEPVQNRSPLCSAVL